MNMQKSYKRNVVAGLDPAFGGSDASILQFGTILPIQGIECICAHPPIKIPFPTSTETPHAHLTRQVAIHLRRWNIAPEHVAIDTTTEGQAIWERLLVEYGRCISCDSAKASSDAQIYAFDSIEGKEKYANRGTELWAITKAFLYCKQLRHVPPETAREFCGRQYKEIAGRIALEAKKDYRARMGHSPDAADAFALMCCAAKEGYGLIPGEHMSVKVEDTSDWEHFAKKFQ